MPSSLNGPLSSDSLLCSWRIDFSVCLNAQSDSPFHQASLSLHRPTSHLVDHIPSSHSSTSFDSPLDVDQAQQPPLSLLVLLYHTLHINSMAASASGALGSTYKITRGLQVVSLIAIIGMTANFVSEMVSANTTPPSILVGTLSIVSVDSVLKLLVHS